jgi:hypothetical protein
MGGGDYFPSGGNIPVAAHEYHNETPMYVPGYTPMNGGGGKGQMRGNAGLMRGGAGLMRGGEWYANMDSVNYGEESPLTVPMPSHEYNETYKEWTPTSQFQQGGGRRQRTKQQQQRGRAH